MDTSPKVEQTPATSGSQVAVESRLSPLEHKYVELLEQRVAELEARLASVTAKPDVSDYI